MAPAAAMSAAAKSATAKSATAMSATAMSATAMSATAMSATVCEGRCGQQDTGNQRCKKDGLHGFLPYYPPDYMVGSGIFVAAGRWIVPKNVSCPRTGLLHWAFFPCHL
jgi:hypothetical protein